MAEKDKEKESLVVKYVDSIQQGIIVDFYDIPEEIRNNSRIVKVEREKKIRRVVSSGYDVLRNVFYVVENVDTYSIYGTVSEKKHRSEIESFSEFYDFIDGDIYSNNCLLYMYDFSKEILQKYNIDISKIHFETTFDEDLSNIMPQKVVQYELCTDDRLINWENEWIEKYRECHTGQALIKLTDEYNKTEQMVDVLYFFWDYIWFYGQDSYDSIMAFISSEKYPANVLKYSVGFIFGVDKVKEDYECRYENYAESTRRGKRTKLRAFYTQSVENGIEERKKGYFCIKTRNYVVSSDLIVKSGPNKGHVVTSIFHYYRCFEDFAEDMCGDLSDCDFTFAREYDIDWKKYQCNENTIFPVNKLSELDKSFEARYDASYDKFYICIYWKDIYGHVIFHEQRIFEYFHELCYFFGNDLSGVDLFTCTGLLRVPSFRNILINKAILCPDLTNKLGIRQEKAKEVVVGTFDNTTDNEDRTQLILSERRPPLSYEQLDEDERNIAYISDLHITNKISGLRTENEQIFRINEMIEGMFEESSPEILIIAGDVSSDYDVFVCFLDLLKKYIDNHRMHTRVIFVLGNHELWPFVGFSITQIIEVYRRVIEEHGMFLIQNEILCFEYGNKIFISEKEILELSREELRKKVVSSNVIIFGGIGFSGCNEEFNSSNGIYHGVISREEEINQTIQFKALYDRVLDVFSDKKIIVLTHMSVPDWNGTYNLQEYFIYVNGHNHRNFYFQDGFQRVYADNQTGYIGIPRLKYFTMNDSFDIFSEHEDGIYEISRREYQEFYRGLKRYVCFNRKYKKLYMLKKNGYYCFIMRSFSDALFILNGGSIERLPCNVIQYFYDNMDSQVARNRKPIIRYTKIQEKIANEIKSFGGSGKIHGAIIDIDFWSHIYLNPIDMKITPYYATDIINKVVYSNVPSLLKYKCPDLYINYKRLVENKISKTAVILYGFSTADIQVGVATYDNTDIYKMSKKIRQMQKINCNILSLWNQNIKGIATLPDCTSKKNHLEKVQVGSTRMMNCGLEATIIEDNGYKDITVQFEDGVIRKHRAKDKFIDGKIGHREK